MTRTHAAAVLTALVLAGCAPGAPAPAPTTSTPAGTPAAGAVTIVRVVDGDTIDIQQAGRTQRVRLASIDAPEAAHGQQPAQCGAGRATRALRDLLSRGQVVVLRLDEVSGHLDRYGRTLGYLEVDGRDVGLALIRAGLAAAWHPTGTPTPTQYPSYAAAHRHAAASGAGSWATCHRVGR